MTRRGTEPERRPVYFRRATDVAKRRFKFRQSLNWRYELKVGDEPDVVKRRLKFRQSLNWRYEVKVGDEPVVVVDAGGLIDLMRGHTTDMSDSMRYAHALHDAGDLTTWARYG